MEQQQLLHEVVHAPEHQRLASHRVGESADVVSAQAHVATKAAELGAQRFQVSVVVVDSVVEVLKDAQLLLKGNNPTLQCVEWLDAWWRSHAASIKRQSVPC